MWEEERGKGGKGRELSFLWLVGDQIKPKGADRFTQIMSVGIGGSALGPQFVAEVGGVAFREHSLPSLQRFLGWCHDEDKSIMQDRKGKMRTNVTTRFDTEGLRLLLSNLGEKAIGSLYIP